MTSLDLVTVRLKTEDTLRHVRPRILHAAEAAEVFQDFLGDLDREMLALLTLDTKGYAINLSVISIGTLNQGIAHPREVFKTAILSNASFVLLGHNHPSGDITPSQNDIELTARIAEAGTLMGIPLRDHIIVGPGEAFYSFREKHEELFLENRTWQERSAKLTAAAGRTLGAKKKDALKR